LTLTWTEFAADSTLEGSGFELVWQPFGESSGRLFAGVLAPFLMVPHVGSPTIFFGTIFVVVAIGASIPLLFGRETVGQLETVTEGVPALA